MNPMFFFFRFLISTPDHPKTHCTLRANLQQQKKHKEPTHPPGGTPIPITSNRTPPSTKKEKKTNPENAVDMSPPPI
jgi:hypothetical protein